MRFILINILIGSLAMLTACNTDSDSDHNAMKDNIYHDQFGALEKAKNVENIVLEAAQSNRELIDEQTN